ncbi:pyrroline-5-carboxylate reductase [Brassicibacter mesophilus]|uniref:pyrroline-5-carboxylate reductase n=1 Tax=Brassicibacter mesophilus TaxID=745119 RepID=UPI003D1C77A8
MYKIGFIGAGNMGYAMLQGLLKQIPKNDIIFNTLSEERKRKISEEFNLQSGKNNIDIASKAKYIILAVKPQTYKIVMEEIAPSLTSEKVIISIAPGIRIDTMKESLGDKIRIVRSMPNTPALVGEGMSIITFSDDVFTEEEVTDIKNIFSSFGEIEILDEKLMDAVVPISGSSPAYVYMMIEAMADGGVLLGLPRKLSYKLAAQSVLGSAKMVLETNTHPGELKDAVCSPGGTTIEAVASLEKRNFRNAIIEAMLSAYEKTKKIK